MPPPLPLAATNEEDNEEDWRFFDRARVFVKGGDGGRGAASERGT